MQILTITPFAGAPLPPAQLRRALERLAAAHPADEPQSDTEPRPPLPPQDKWELLRCLTRARAAYRLKDRSLTVLTALVSFHPTRRLEDRSALVVFPSNAALAARAHGMAESTLRRHLSALVEAGLIARHDSPNGKRYRRLGGEAAGEAFGFDLRPLLAAAGAIRAAAAEAEAEAARLADLREAAVLARRDALRLIEAAGEAGAALPKPLAEAEALRRELRRKMPLPMLEALLDRARALRALVVDILRRRLPDPAPRTTETGADDARIERHLSESQTDSLDRRTAPLVGSRPAPRPGAGNEDGPSGDPEADHSRSCKARDPARLPLHLVLRACPDILSYAPDGIRDWPDLQAAARTLAPMMGIDGGSWRAAERTMGPGCAAVTLAAMLQRIGTLRNPGAYLRRLTLRAQEGRFTPGGMIRALLSGPPDAVQS